jgi:glutathione synthase/RimK-type ligase-like ATP-grasp enzyme
MSARPPLVLLGNLENRRAQFFLQAAAALGWESVQTLSWLDFLANPDALTAKLAPDGWLRIESPGENFALEKALLALGAGLPDSPRYLRLSAAEVSSLDFRRGQILPMRQWYLGWRKTLDRVDQCLNEVKGRRAMNPPGDIADMFDKARCHELFKAARVPVPRLLGLPESFEHLRELMREAHCRRVFLKPCHSSSASGVVALETSKTGWQAFSSVELTGETGPCGLFNSLRVRRYRESRQIAALIDAVCRHRCIAEAWFPKAGYGGQRFDLRVLVIARRAGHAVMRQSAGPITNLHLGNRRGDLEGLRGQMGESRWQEAVSVAEQAAAVFPDSLYVGVDLLAAPGFERFAIAEVNAFGDLLPHLLHEGRDTYGAELANLIPEPSVTLPGALVH